MLYISIFVLELNNNIIMKKSIMVFMVCILVCISVFMWLNYAVWPLGSAEIIQIGIIVLIVVFALFAGIKRLKSEKRGEPAEDELSKKITMKAASWSYYISLYLWVAMMYIKDRVLMDSEQLLGAGILGMACIFALSWLIVRYKGIPHE